MSSDGAAPAAKAKTPKASKPKAAKSAGPKHSYVDLISEAILGLHERNGSSAVAIKKFLEGHGKTKDLGEGWEKRLSNAIKAMRASGKLVRASRAWPPQSTLFALPVSHSTQARPKLQHMSAQHATAALAAQQLGCAARPDAAPMEMQVFLTCA